MDNLTAALMFICAGMAVLLYFFWLHFEKAIKRERRLHALALYWRLMRDYDTATCEAILSSIKNSHQLKEFNKKILKIDKNAKLRRTVSAH